MTTQKEKLEILKVNQRRMELMSRLFIVASAMGVSFTHEDVGVVGLWLMDFCQANKKIFADVKEGNDG